MAQSKAACSFGITSSLEAECISDQIKPTPNSISGKHVSLYKVEKTKIQNSHARVEKISKGGQKEDKRRTKLGQKEDKRRTKGGQKEDKRRTK